MSNNTESGKMSDIMRGVKHGAVKQSVDSIVNLVADPMSKTLREKLNLDDSVAGDLSDALVRFIIMIGLAGGLELMGEQLGGIIGDEGDEKSKLIAAYLRQYAGENLGEKGMKRVVEAIPELFSKFREIPTEDLRYVLGQKSVIYTEEIPEFQVKEEAVITRVPISKQLQEEEILQEKEVRNVKL